MKNILRLLLLTPFLALAQELPDEDWVCITTHHQDSILFSEDNTLENLKLDALPTYVFNPSKGYRFVEDSDYLSRDCAIRNTVRGPDIYVCSGTSVLGGETVFALNKREGKFNYTFTQLDVHRQSVGILMGDCNKI